jgi:hypothetical protein
MSERAILISLEEALALAVAVRRATLLGVQQADQR